MQNITFQNLNKPLNHSNDIIIASQLRGHETQLSSNNYQNELDSSSMADNFMLGLTCLTVGAVIGMGIGYSVMQITGVHPTHPGYMELV